MENEEMIRQKMAEKREALTEKLETLEQKVAEKDKQAQEYLAKYRQAASEFEEARLRLRREISKDIERARRDLISDFLEVVDNLDRAIDAGRRASTSDSLLQGVEMVQRQFLSKLEALGVKAIESIGAPFDPSLHEAVSTVPAAAPDQDGRNLAQSRDARQSRPGLRPCGRRPTPAP